MIMLMSTKSGHTRILTIKFVHQYCGRQSQLIPLKCAGYNFLVAILGTIIYTYRNFDHIDFVTGLWTNGPGFIIQLLSKNTLTLYCLLLS